MLCCIAPNATHHFYFLAEMVTARPCGVSPFLLISCVLSVRRDASIGASYVTSRGPAGMRQFLARVHQHNLSETSAPSQRYVSPKMQIPATIEWLDTCIVSRSANVWLATCANDSPRYPPVQSNITSLLLLIVLSKPLDATISAIEHPAISPSARNTLELSTLLARLSTDILVIRKQIKIQSYEADVEPLNVSGSRRLWIP
jgi:hypothetical protein